MTEAVPPLSENMSGRGGAQRRFARARRFVSRFELGHYSRLHDFDNHFHAGYSHHSHFHPNYFHRPPFAISSGKALPRTPHLDSWWTLKNTPSRRSYASGRLESPFTTMISPRYAAGEAVPVPAPLNLRAPRLQTGERWGRLHRKRIFCRPLSL
jgi:hypothetical protein